MKQSFPAGNPDTGDQGPLLQGWRYMGKELKGGKIAKDPVRTDQCGLKVPPAPCGFDDVEANSLPYGKTTDRNPAESAYMSSATQGLADLTRQNPDIGPLRTVDLKGNDPVRPCDELERIYRDEPGGPVDSDPLAGQLVKGNSLLLDSRKHGGFLHMIPDKP